MNKKLIKWQFLDWMPLILIMCIVYAVVLLPTYLTYNPTRYSVASETGMVSVWTAGAPAVTYFHTLSFIFACIAPIFVYRYRFNKRKVDTFYQLPLKEKEFRNTRIILALLIQIAILTIFYWICVLILFSKQIPAIESMRTMYPNADQTGLIAFNYIYYVPYYFMLIAVTAGTYFISCFATYLSNNLITCVFYILVAWFLLGFTCYGGYIIVAKLSGGSHNYITYMSLTYSPYPVGLGNGLYGLFMNWIDPKHYLAINDNGQVARIIVSLSESVVFGITSAIYCLLVREPSGENAGSNDGVYKWTCFTPHAAFFIIGLLLVRFTSITELASVLITIPLFIIIYYLALVLLRKIFKINKVDLITLIVISLFDTIIILIPTI
jgi:hypothetical protein